MSGQSPPPYSPLPSDAPPSYTEQSTVNSVSLRNHHEALPPAEEGYTPVGTDGVITSTPSGETSLPGTSPAPAAPPTTTTGRPTRPIPIPRSTDNFILTIFMMVLCGLMLNVLAFACLVPALIYSRKAADANRRGEYFQARKHAQTSFWFSLSAIIMFIIIVLFGVSLGFVFGITRP